jgi:hypothetical protein
VKQSVRYAASLIDNDVDVCVNQENVDFKNLNSSLDRFSTQDRSGRLSIRESMENRDALEMAKAMASRIHK